MSVITIHPRQLEEQRRTGTVDLIDVRTPAEFREVHVEFARNVPLDQLDPAALTAGRNGAPLYFICKSGSRGQKACERMVADGHTNIVNVEGGTQACIDAGLPVIRGPKTMSLERQVRIAAGSLVLIGCVLAYFVHPYFLALSAFIGAGLVFAGITDTCGMGMMLAKLPWNQK
jgi:rhodanese-related sulfurtransferase